MTPYTTEPATPATLTDFFALVPDPAEAARRQAALRANLEAGRVRLGDLLILRSPRGVEGTVQVPRVEAVPLFPALRPDVRPEGVTLLMRTLWERAEPQRRLVLQESLAPLDAAPALAAGWVFDEEYLMYTTDLRARPFPRDPQAVIGDAAWLALPEVQALLAADGNTDYELGEGDRLVALQDAGELQAFGKVGPSGRPDWAGVHMIGVRPEARGRGLGARLHAHLLALAAEDFAWHGGGTGAENHAMRRVFEKSGSVLTELQVYFRRS